ncbi:salicylate hydroxylase [Hoeflea halophila]|uniref:Salicylate hydroxylase n=1 Tax=Hoeflea halophila TaxID=714899 RepID=A0A286HLH5_9HYPH|nr:FAD-dependent monooxygenase [Hoeflea halophila]SOE08346.1 salicylate hydroxylase [Hoeflea halophila]
MTSRNILVIGAGIGGLTTALAFAAGGDRVDIVEQAPELSEVGAGLQVSPNASRILVALGLGDRLRKAMIVPHEIVLASGQTLRRITHVPCGGFAEDRWGAPYGVMHRADLQKLLLDAVAAHADCHLHLGQRIQNTNINSLHARLGRPAPDLVVGADGVWSQIRKLVPGAFEPRFSGQIAWRFTLPADVARSVLDPVNVTAFMGPRTHLVTYPLDRGETINMVAITRGIQRGETWNSQETGSDRPGLLSAFAGWHNSIVSILRQPPEMNCWPLYEVPDGPWHNNEKTVLIGDAAHAMTPYAAQGAAMAIEDGYELAQACAHRDAGELGSALAGFVAARRARVARTRGRGAFNQFAYHARGPIRLGRDLVLSLKPPESLAADLDWLYGYRASGL